MCILASVCELRSRYCAAPILHVLADRHKRKPKRDDVPLTDAELRRLIFLATRAKNGHCEAVFIEPRAKGRGGLRIKALGDT